MTEIANRYPTFLGKNLVATPGLFGELKSSRSLFGNAEALRARMREDGYLYLPGLLNRERVLAGRTSLLEKLEAEGALDPTYPRNEAMARNGVAHAFRPDLAANDPAVAAVLYDNEIMAFWEHFLGGDVLHFDFTWLRAKFPAEHTVTSPHCDIVYMGRGTPDLYTAWIPFSDVPYDFGGLMILEGSHRKEDVLGEYWKMDVDAFCSNGPEAEGIKSGEIYWQSDKHGGNFHNDAVALQSEIGGRWLGAEFKMGDVLLFSMHTLHSAADNRTLRIRLSTDSRYQLASEPADERWIGPNPVGHGPAGKKGMTC